MAGRSVVLTERTTIIGSVGGQGAVIVLADPAVSEVHVRIERKQGAFRLLDAGSTNGTYVNGLQCQELVLRCDDTLRLGNSEATFRLVP